MMGGGNGNGNKNNDQEAFDAEGDGLDGGMAMMGVLATLKSGAGGAWDAYNAQLEETPILVKVCVCVCCALL